MTTNQFDAAIKTLVESFPNQVKQEHKKVLRDPFLGLSFNSVCDAIKTHRAAHERMNIVKLIEGCMAAERGASLEPKTTRAQSFADIYRKHGLEKYPDDRWIIVIVHWGWWRRSTSKSDGCRRSLSNSCWMALMSPGQIVQSGESRQVRQLMTDEMAKKFSGDVNNPSELGIIFDESADYVRNCLEELHNLPAAEAQAA